MKNFLIGISILIKAPLLKLLKQEAIQLALAGLIKKPWLVDFRTWAVSFIVNYLFDHMAKPVVDYFFQKVNYKVEVISGEYILKKIQDAKNDIEWESAVHHV